jgi:hypothetical protein
MKIPVMITGKPSESTIVYLPNISLPACHCNRRTVTKNNAVQCQFDRRAKGDFRLTAYICIKWDWGVTAATHDVFRPDALLSKSESTLYITVRNDAGVQSIRV